ncbi:ice-binding family protein [Horticoccus luteus]|uniref:Ice-binding family protein n=1 Tax=Horticoccus luteus TaxID=2862869 RepID=A0A8F9TY72_9BACT|nr:ice-binding family protein [Horticoccus luteus]QYM80398.1 ice-binding family protein [Horticoccus luteus]
MKNQPPFREICTLAASLVFLALAPSSQAQLIGAAGSYGVLGGSAVTNTGNTMITGDLGVSPGTAVTGFSALDGGPGLYSGASNLGNFASAQAHADAASAYTTLAGLSFTSDLTGLDLGGLTLTPGVYRFSSSAQLTGTLTLDAQGDANARFVFQIGSTLISASNSAVNIVNIGDACGPDNGLFWQVGSSATLGTGSAFAGNILALASITLNTGASIDFGRALALNGAVTLDNNRIDASAIDGGFCSPQLTPVPEPSTYGAMGAGLLLIVLSRRRIAGRKHAAA